jgi:tetratricopeptide (TPR) repeat protein
VAAKVRWFAIGLSLLLAGTALAVSFWWMLGGNGIGPDSASPPALSERALTPIAAPQLVLPDSRYLNTASAAQYVGTARCSQCHADQHATFLASAHSRSMCRVDPASEPPDGVYDHAASGRRYRSKRNEDGLYHQEALLGPAGQELPLADERLAYLVGSGRFSRTYLVEDDGFFVESPLTWYASLNAWAMSPGYDHPHHQSFHRTITQDCLFCHAGQSEPLAGSDRLRIRETAISCERCHGPGSLHVAHWESPGNKPTGAEDLTIVHPGRLPRELSEAICQQCHLNGEAQVAVRGRSAADFRPGRLWQDFVIDFVDAPAKSAHTSGSEPGGMTVVGHVAQLHQSRCYLASDTLTCTTCHNPHEADASPSSATRLARNRQACLACHADGACGIAAAERIAANDNDCAACHMPQSPTDIPHIAFTHHRIGIHPPPRERPARALTDPPAEAAAFTPLVPALPVDHLPEFERQRAAVLANLRYYEQHAIEPAASEYLHEAARLADDLLRRCEPDANLAAAQAELAAAAGQIAAARESAQRVLADHADPAARTAARRVLATTAMQTQRPSEAIPHLRELTRAHRDPRDWLLLGAAEERTGNPSGAIAAFERVLEIDPAQPETYDLLAPLYEAEGSRDRAEWCRQQAAQIRALTRR